MNYLKRAWCYVTRRITKTILLMVTFFVIGNFVVLGLGISQAAENAKILTRQQMKAVVNYEVDSNAYYNYVASLTDQDEIDKAYQNYPTLDVQAALDLAKDERVAAYNYLGSSQAYSVEFDNVPVGNENQNQNSFNTTIDENGNVTEWKMPNMMIKANMYPDMIELKDGTYTVDSGNFYTQNDIDNHNPVVLVTKELAELNNLHVGDTIILQFLDDGTLQSIVKDNYATTEDLQLSLEICGIYSTTQEVDPNSQEFKWMSPYESPKNVLLMPLTTYATATAHMNWLVNDYYMKTSPGYGSETSEEEMYQNLVSPSKIIYLLKDPLDVDQFVEDYSSKLGEYQKLDANNETFKKLARPLDTLNFFASIIVWIVVLNAVVIISLVTALTLKTREFEIGVLLSMGVSKFKVVLQLFVELFVIAMLGFSLAVISGSLMAGQVGEMVLNYQTSNDAQYEDSEENYYDFSDTTDYFTDVSQDDLLSQYHVSVSPWIILQIYLLGTGVVFIAILIPSAMIMRLNPKQILLATN